MPRYTNDSLIVDELEASGRIKIGADVEYTVDQFRYLRLPAYEFTIQTPWPTVLLAPGAANGRPIRVTLSGATEDAFFTKPLRLPFHVSFNTAYVISRHPGAMSNKSELSFRRINPGGDTKIGGTTYVPHWGDTVHMTTISLTGAGTQVDTQLTVDPVDENDFEFYELDFRMLWDSTLASGAQQHYFYGIILKYWHESSNVGRYLREST